MEAMNAASLEPIEQAAARFRVHPDTPSSAPETAADLRAELTDAWTVSLSAPDASQPKNIAIRSVISNVGGYATSLAAVPGAVNHALLQALADVSVLARLGSQPSAVSVKGAMRDMLAAACRRIQQTRDANERIALLSQATQDAQVAGHIVAQDDDLHQLDALATRLLTLANVQKDAQNRADVTASGVRILVGLLSVQPQILQADASNIPIPVEAFAMPADRRAVLGQLWQRVAGTSTRIPHGTACGDYSLQEGLARLLRRRAFDRKDSDGADLLDNLEHLANQPMATGLDRDLLVAQAIVHTAWPEQTIIQGDHRTCGAATMSYTLASERPAEYVRLIAGLSSPEGQARLGPGVVASRAPDSLGDDGSGRTLTERLVQSALMDLSGKGVHYQNLADGFFDDNQQLVQFGIYPQALAGVEHALGEGDFEALSGVSRETLLEALKRNDNTVPAVIEGTNADHWVLVRGVDAERVYFHNPKGDPSEGFDSLPIDDFVRRARVVLQRTDRAVEKGREIMTFLPLPVPPHPQGP